MTDYSDILIYAETVDDLERSRIALDNRIRAMTKRKDVNLPLMDLADQMQSMEAGAIKGLQKTVRGHPLGPWILAQKGVGEKQAGRLLAVIGDPADRPNPAKLWAYCGMHVVNGHAPRRERGVQGNWNENARMRVRMIAESCIKQDGHYRDVYDQARKKYAESVHTDECRRCGPKGKPAQPGSPLSDGHKHARALRIVGKEILKDMWIEAHRLRRDQPNLETQVFNVPALT